MARILVPSRRSSHMLVAAIIIALTLFLFATPWLDARASLITRLPVLWPTNNGDPALEDRLQLAEALWQKSVQQRGKMIHSGFSEDPLKAPSAFIYPYNVWDLFRPTFFCPHDLERVGFAGDGGKWICGMRRYETVAPGPASARKSPELVVYSFGINTDSSFEAALLERTNPGIWGYDYSVDGWGEQLSSETPRLHFSKVAIGGKTVPKDSSRTMSIPDVMRQNGHDYVDIMKIDIEGFEFEALDSLMDLAEESPLRTLPVGQLLLELHLEASENIQQTVQALMTWWERLESLGMRPVFSEHNFIGNVWAAKGYPAYVEVRIGYRLQILSHFD